MSGARMRRAFWRLSNGRPVIEVDLREASSGDPLTRMLLADTGAGDSLAGFELILHEDDCLLAGGRPLHSVSLGGAYAGQFAVYLVRIAIPPLGFDHYVRAVGVPDTQNDFDGIACFRFLNRFSYGNFGDANSFALER